MEKYNNALLSHTITCEDGTQKQLQICHGDICDINEQYDVLVCSAFKDDYRTLSNTLIGSLYEKKGISVENLAKEPEIDLKKQGCWVSKAIEGNFKRIACVELLERSQFEHTELVSSIVLKNTFFALRVLLTQLDIESHSVASVVLPILGCGNQGIEMCYIVPILLSQCIEVLQSIPQLKKITFYEQDLDKANLLQEMCSNALNISNNVPDVFISYCSKQQQLAYRLKEFLEKNQIICWMAPESIPVGSSYQMEIPKALSQIPVVLLILSPEAEQSRWVQKEIGCTIGAKHELIPYKCQSYEHSQQFNFLLDGEQIFEAYRYAEDDAFTQLNNVVIEKLKLSQTSTGLHHKKITECNTRAVELECMSDYEILSLLTHFAFDPEYADKKYILSKIRRMLIDEQVN